MSPKQVKDFILWLRKERISCTSLTIGGIMLDGLVDGKALTAKPAEQPEPPKTMWERYGGELLNQPASPVDEVPDEAKVD